jgi:hypothetical protein
MKTKLPITALLLVLAFFSMYAQNDWPIAFDFKTSP